MRHFGIDADRDLMVDFDHAVLFADIGMCQVLGPKRSSPQPQVPIRRKSKIRYSCTATRQVWRNSGSLPATSTRSAGCTSV